MKPVGGGIGGALELLEPSHAQSPPSVEARAIQVQALAVVASLGPQLLESALFMIRHLQSTHVRFRGAALDARL